MAGTAAIDSASRTRARDAQRFAAYADSGLVAFVQRASTGDVLQAHALPLDDCPSP